MESLKKGQTHNVLVSSLNPKLIVDGYKRRIAAINSNVELKTEVREHKTVDEWLQDLMNHASCPETKASVKDKYEALKTAFPELGTESIIQILVKITGKSRMTLYRWLELVSNDTDSNKPTRGMKKCMVCPLAQNNKNLEEELARVREQYKKALESMEEVISSDEFRLSKAINLFLQKHPNKEFTSDGRILDKLT
jgi:protoheme ferro-lyase